MKAMVLERLGPVESRPLSMREVPTCRVESPRQVLIRIEACGVCHSQLHGIEGDWKELGIPPQLPTIPGHEIVGTVVEAGEQVTRFRKGQRAGVSPLLETCRRCEHCLGGNEQRCEKSETLGEGMRGGYAQYVNVHEDFAVPVPASMSPEYAAPLFCAGITAYKAVKAAEPRPGRSVGIFGMGGVGHMAVQFAKLEGMRVSAVSRAERHLAVARRLGADEACGYGELSGPLDSAIVLAPSDDATEEAVRSVKRGGTVVVATIGQVRGFVAFEEKTVRGTLIGSVRDMEEVVRIAAEKRLEVIHESFPMGQANEVLERLKNSQVDARAVLVPWKD